MFTNSRSRLTCRAAPLGAMYRSLVNGVWSVTTNMATVGYGDLFARTHYGRMFACVGMFCGQFVISLFLIAMAITSQFSLAEARAHAAIQTVDFYSARARLAASIITTYSLCVLCERSAGRGERGGRGRGVGVGVEDSEESEGGGGVGRQQRTRGDARRSTPTSSGSGGGGGGRTGGGGVLRRYDKIGLSQASRMLKVQYMRLTREFRELNA